MASQYAGPIMEWLTANPGRQRTRDVADGVGMLLTGRKAAFRRREDEGAVLYDTITKQLWYMVQEGHVDFRPTLMRDGRGGWWVEGMPPDPMGIFTPAVNDALRLLHRPEPSQERKAGTYGRRSASAERRLLPDVLRATHRTCGGCGKADPRASAHLWQADLIIPASDGGKAELGNVQPLCWPCNNRKRDLSMEDLWDANVEDGAMWDEGAAKAAFALAAALR